MTPEQDGALSLLTGAAAWSKIFGVRSWRLITRVVLVAVVATAVFTTDGSAALTSVSADGKFFGEAVVGKLARSITLKAKTHSVRAGSQLNLHGTITVATGGPLCGGSSGAIWVLRRHDRSHAFKRIVPHAPIKRQKLRMGRDSCTYAWQLNVRPGERLTYIAQARGDERLYEDAWSSPFTVVIRH